MARFQAVENQIAEKKTQRLVVVFALVVSYSWYYVCRLSLSYAGHAVVKKEGLDLRKLGAILSSGQISIGLSKIMSSVLTADLSPSRCLIFGLLLTAACNVLASAMPAANATELALVLAALWAVNGLFQGLGSPSCARIINAWCSAKERGFFWSLWNISNNLGGALAPLIVSLGAPAGWRGSLLLAGSSAAVVSIFMALLVQDSPDGQMTAVKSTVSQGSEEPHLKGLSLLWKGVLLQPGMASLAVANFVIYGLKSSLISWLAFYVHAHGQNVLSAATRLSTFEIGGLFGSLVSGPLSDKYWHLQGSEAPLVGSRLQVASAAVLAILVPSMMSVVFGPSRISFVAMFCVGFSLYVAQSLAALSGLELVTGRAAGVSQGLLGWSAYTGAAASGLPLGWIIQSTGWQSWRLVMAGGSMLVVLLFLPLWRLPSNEQRQAAKVSSK